MNILGSINGFLFKPYAAIIIPFSNLIVSASTPTSLVLNSTIADSQTPSKNYTFVGQTGDTGTVGLTNSKYAMYLNTGTLSSTTLKWPGSSSGVTFMAWVQITSLQAYHSIVGFGVDSDGVGMSLLIIMVHWYVMATLMELQTKPVWRHYPPGNGIIYVAR